jgi:nucleoside-diphosphate-sugar epimerase
MRATVLGAGGFIGRHLAAALRETGVEVLAPGRNDPLPLGRSLGHVFYCIGLTADFRSRPFDTVRAHVSTLASVLERAEFDSLLYLSSTRVYARAATGAEDQPLSVNSADPSDLYNLTKLTGEALCRSCGRYQVRVARLSNVIGPNPASENFVSDLIREALSGHITLRTHPCSEKDYIAIDDVVAVLPRIALEGRHWLYNVASGTNISHGAIADRLATLTNCSVTVQPAAPRSSFPWIDTTRVRAEFDIAPRAALDLLPALVAEAQRETA